MCVVSTNPFACYLMRS